MKDLARKWLLPSFDVTPDLAEWLGISTKRLEWLADCQTRNRHVPAGALQHYHYRWAPQQSGGYRLIESPKSKLKALQKQLLEEILDRMLPHRAAHGFRRRRSVRSFAEPHVGSKLVLRCDLRNFFASVTAARVTALFLTCGYPEPVAHALAGLCTNCVPQGVLDAYPAHESALARARLHSRFTIPHLPQGAPTSPALANLCAYRLDCRLHGLARAADARYTRYADDLLFSGGPSFARHARRFAIHVAAACLEEGFEVHPHKTRLMGQGVCQHAAGLVLNARVNIRRTDYDRLKAILHNCLRHGPQSQQRNVRGDFRAHLLGKIAHVASIHPERGAKLRASFNRIAWA